MTGVLVLYEKNVLIFVKNILIFLRDVHGLPKSILKWENDSNHFPRVPKEIYVIIRVIRVRPLGKNVLIFLRDVLIFLKNVCGVPMSILR